MSKVLVICARRYNGHELWTLLGVLQQRGHAFDVVSTAYVIRDELTMQPNTIPRLLYEVQPEEHVNYDGICVVSGNMSDTEAYWTDPHVIDLLQTFRAADKVVAAICCSVPTLAPVVRDVKVSFFPLIRSRKRLAAHGALLQAVSLTVDKKTVTAENQMFTQMWGEEICNLLEGKTSEVNLKASGFIPQGRPRRMPADVQEAIDFAKAQKKDS